MLSMKLSPAWTPPVAQLMAEVLENAALAARLSDTEAQTVVDLLKPHVFKPRVCALPKIDEMGTSEVEVRLEDFVDSPNSPDALSNPSLPKVEIEQAVLLEIACMTALSPEFEVKAFLGVEQDASNATFRIRHVAVQPKQLVTKDTLNGDIYSATLVPYMAEKANIGVEEMYPLLHGDFHTHVRGDAVPSRTDLSGWKLHVLGTWDNLQVPGVVRQKWWLGLISNLHGVLRVFLFDAENHRFYCDLPWTVTKTVANPALWVKQQITTILQHMQREVVCRDMDYLHRKLNLAADPNQGEVDDNDGQIVIDMEPESVSDSPPESVNPPAQAPSVATPVRKQSPVMLAAVAVLALLLGLGLGLELNSHYGWESLSSKVAMIVGSPEKAPVAEALAAAPEPTAPALPASPPTELRAPVAQKAASVPEPTPPPSAEPKPAPVTPGAPVQAVAAETPPVALPAATQEPAPGESVAAATPAVTATTPVPVAPKTTTEELAKRFEGVTRPERIWPEYARFSKVPTSMLKQFGGMTTEEFYAWRKEHPTERRRVPLVVDEAFMEGHEARRPDVHCRVCGSGKHKPFCDQYVDKRDLQEACDRGARFLGDDEKPLRKVLETRLEEKAKAKAGQ